MATYLYGVLLSRNAGRVGTLAAGARVLRCDALAAIVSTTDARASKPDLADIRRHDGVLTEAVNMGATVLAARFGQRFDDDAACCADVRERGAQLTAALEAHDGCVEMRVLRRISAEPVAPPPAASAPGRAYLEQLRSREVLLASHALKEALGTVVRAEVIHAPEPNTELLTVSHLVRAEDVDAYRAALARQPGLSDARVVGPLPLYSFAGA